MARVRIDKELRREILNARGMIEAVAKADGNEAETRRRVERMFESIMGYNVFQHVSREHAVKGAGETEHCDFAIQIESGETARPMIIVELKRANIDLAVKHLKQVSSYAINAGCEWIVLTNGKEWRLYHVSFGQPPETKLLESWNLMTDDPSVLAEKFAMIAYKNVKRGGLDELWTKTNVLTTENVLRQILSEDCIKLLRKGLRKSTSILISPEEIITAIRRMLNESAASEMASIKICLPARKKERRRTASVEKQSTTDRNEAPQSATGETCSDCRDIASP